MGNKVRISLVLGLLIALGTALIVSPVAAASLDWEFEVSLNEKKIGYHSFTVTEEAGRQVLETEAAFDVKLLFITAFKYRHSNTEIWDNGCLESIDARTNSNGKLFEVKGSRNQDRLAVVSSTGDEELGDCVKTFAYWNPEVLESTRLLNSQTGEYESVAVSVDGDDTVAVNGEATDAVRYTLTTKGGDIKLWYAKDTDLWLALEAPAKGGRTIRYTPLSVPRAPAA